MSADHIDGPARAASAPAAKAAEQAQPAEPAERAHQPQAAEPATPATDEAAFVLRLADDALVLSHRLAEWVAWAPAIEEDLALANIGLDLLGQARALLTYAGQLEGAGRTEDDLAYLRAEHELRCVLLVEEPSRHDFARLMAQLLYFSAYAVPMLTGLTASRDEHLAALAAKAVKEARYHLEHAAAWVIRLGDGTEESHARMQHALDELWPLTGDLTADDELTRRMVAAGIAPDLGSVRAEWEQSVAQVLAEATLQRPSAALRTGRGRLGLHSEHLGYLLAEMQYVHRLHPGAQW